MSAFIFDLQRFPNSSGSSGSSSGSSGGTGASSGGGSNSKTDGDTTVAAAAIWKDGWKAYSTKDRSDFAATAYSLLQTVAPNEYVATAGADLIPVSGVVNNVIYGVDRLDNIKFTDMYLESFAAFYDYTERNSYVDLIFSTGSVTRLYLADSGFTPTLTFASGLSEAYSFPSKEKADDGNSIYPGGWFGSEELATSTAYWNADGFMPNYTPAIGSESDVLPVIPVSRTTNTFVSAGSQDEILLSDVSSLAEIAVKPGTGGYVPTADSSVEGKKSNALNLIFSNGTAALIYYTDNVDSEYVPSTRRYSPTFYLADGSAYVYNSELGWRTYAQAADDATKAASDKLQTLTDRLSFDANFNTVYDTELHFDKAGQLIDPWDSYTKFAVSRGANNMFYNTWATNGIYFADALPANIVSALPEGDSYINIAFDTGTLTRVEYEGVVSPIVTFADGTAQVYNLVRHDFVNAYSGSYVDGSTQNVDGSTTPNIVYGTNAIIMGSSLKNATAIPESTDSSTGTTDTSSGSSGTTDTSSGTYTDEVVIPEPEYASEVDVVDPPDVSDTEQVVIPEPEYASEVDVVDPPDVSFDSATDGLAVSYQPASDEELLQIELLNIGHTGATTPGGVKNQQQREASDLFRETSRNFEVFSESFMISRNDSSFINQVTAYDDIWLSDTSFENITDFNIIGGYAISLNFDTGENLRVQDESPISPVFHFADGTSTAYNWMVNQWVGNVDAADNNTTDVFTLSATDNSFIRNAEQQDIIHIVDANVSDIAQIDANRNYVNIIFDKGESVAVSYTDDYSPVFLFADGSAYHYRGITQDVRTGEYVGRWLPFSSTNTVEYNATSYDDVLPISKATNTLVNGANSCDIINIVDANYSDTSIFVDNDAYTSTISVAFNDTGTTASVPFDTTLYSYAFSPIFHFADGQDFGYDVTTGKWSRAYNTSDIIDTFSLSCTADSMVYNAGEEDYVYINDATMGNLTDFAYDGWHVRLTFDTGKTIAVRYTDFTSPTFVFADGTSYTYNYSSGWAAPSTVTAAYYDTYNLSKEQDYDLSNLSDLNTVNFTDATKADVTKMYFSTSSGAPYIEFVFDTGKITTVRYDDYEYSPLFTFSDGSTAQYYGYDANYGSVDNYTFSKYVDHIVYWAGKEDTINFYDANILNITDIDTSSGIQMIITFDTGAKTAVGYYGYSDGRSPTFNFENGQSFYYNREEGTWVSSTGDKYTYDNGTWTLFTPEPTTPAPDDITPEPRPDDTDTPTTPSTGTTEVKSSENNTLNDMDSEDTVKFTDANKSDVASIDYSVYSGDPYIRFNFDNNGTTTSTYVNYELNTDSTEIVKTKTPTFEWQDGTKYYYTCYDQSINADEFSLKSTDYSIIYYARPEDTVQFTDANLSDVTKVENDNGSQITFTFKDGTTTTVGYLGYVYGISPKIEFKNGDVYRYVRSTSSESDKDVWQKADTSSSTSTTTVWEDYSEGKDSLVTTSSSTEDSDSSDLWGDTFTGTAEADNLFVGKYANTIVRDVDAKDSVTFDATLSDIVATSVEGNTIAVAFGTGATAVIQTAGDSPTFNLVSGESFTYDRQASAWKTA